MLAAVERDHLSGHRRRVEQETQRRRDLLRRGAAAQRHGAALLEELLVALARVEMEDVGGAAGARNFAAATLQDARAAFARVAADIGTQYSLGYYPTNKARDGKFRSIKVEVRGLTGKNEVRAREGYQAPKG